MNISKYVRLISQKNSYYIYNSLTNFFAEIDNCFFDFIKEKQETQAAVMEEEMGSDLWNTFCSKKIITENDNDDILLYEAAIKSKRQINDILLLTIAPTMDCNFSCPYCFETREKGIMKNQIMQNLLKWMLSCENISHVNITWFGGEPLLAPHIIKKITHEIKKQLNVKLSSSIITNGYYLTEKNIKLLEDCNVNSIQMSIDGIYDTHNKKRFSKNDKNTFETILKNIDTFHQMRPNINMTIRVGVDKDNIQEYPHIHNFFIKRYAGNENIQVAPALIIETTKSCMESCITNQMEKFSFYEKFTKQTNNIHFIYPSNTVSECAVRNRNSWVIDAKGGLYKCWEIIGNHDYKVGEIREDGLVITNGKILNRYLYGADPFEDGDCQNCFSLPICGGGCPHKRIENKFNHREFDSCTYFNQNLDRYLLLYRQSNEKISQN